MIKINPDDLVVIDAGCCTICHGEKDVCITQIKIIVEDGNVAFMPYAEHVREKIEELGYHIEMLNPNDMPIPIGMYIMKKQS